MKKLLASLLLSVALTAALPMVTFADSFRAEVSGVVSYNGQPVNSAKVTGVCGGVTKHDTTNSHGLYRLRFKSMDCPNGTAISLSAMKKDKSGTNSVTSAMFVTGNIVLGKTVALPELGWVTGATAMLGAVAIFGGIRRRQHSISHV